MRARVTDVENKWSEVFEKVEFALFRGFQGFSQRGCGIVM